ncbi:MAG TPA: amino acid adenylation domain-containing protein [Puia sp.]|nr:amino acid adenylation domain-containing protein [Puia sp.]
MIKDLWDSLEKNAQRPAFCIGDRHFSYRDLSGVAGRVQEAIRRSGGSATGRVGIVTTDSIETYAAILACWFLGYAYVPLHPKNPDDRNKAIIRDAGLDLVLSPDAGYRDFAAYGLPFRVVATATSGEAAPLLSKTWKDDDLLYVLFTSGSTGVPKGVPITLGNIRTFLDSYDALGFRCDASDRFLQMFDLTFDVSIASYLVPLLLGACVYTVPAEGIKYMNVYKLIQKYEISFASVVPSIINYLKPYFPEISLPKLRYCILTAEASNVRVVGEWLGCMPNGQVVNLYGPTEATIWCTGYFFDPSRVKSYNDMMIIGKPFRNVDVLILDEEGKEVAPGEKGEFHVSSGQVTPGYLNNEERNRTAFPVRNGRRYYKTGDVCYVDGDGDIFYCGRADHQVKIQGFRIELSEIEVVARDLFSLNTAAVVYKNALGVPQLGLFLERYSGEVDRVRTSLEEKLPYYMIPSAIQVIDNLPYNNSGKIDRVSLVKLFQ